MKIFGMSHITRGPVKIKISSDWSHITKDDELNEMAQYISLLEGTDWTSSCMGGKEAETASTGFARCNDVNWGYVELILVHFFIKVIQNIKKFGIPQNLVGKLKEVDFWGFFNELNLNLKFFLGGQIAWSWNIKIVVSVCPQLYLYLITRRNI